MSEYARFFASFLSTLVSLFSSYSFIRVSLFSIFQTHNIDTTSVALAPILHATNREEKNQNEKKMNEQVTPLLASHNTEPFYYENGFSCFGFLYVNAFRFKQHNIIQRMLGFIVHM